ncbi:alpha-amylase family glycosyl hydrolase [Rhodobacter sp. NSM]|uniref:alpha-amylase family glycosyl hydrolase n=1 Tax=Rhodobacter sp. NSM TaxID=3457501 RepID=UPI003FD0F172
MSDWWRGSVTYQIYPRSFQDSDGDGVGDLRGILERLDHVAWLGADAIWLSPFFPSPMDDMGYDVSDYTGIDPLFGRMEDFDALLARAHELGLKVIIDQVLSHSSSQHPFFRESRRSRNNPKADWYVWADPQPDGSPPNNWLSIFGGPAWEWEPQRRQYYLHNFLTTQPDFNFHNRAVQDWLLDQMRFWLDKGVDGFRLDTVNFYFHDAQLRPNRPNPSNGEIPAINPYDMQDHAFSKSQAENIGFLLRMRSLLDEYPDRTMVGEVADGIRALAIMAEYTSGSERLHMAYTFEMLSRIFTATHFRSRIETFFETAPHGWPCWAFSNHDVVRHVTRWAGHGASDDVARLSAAMLLSFEGSVSLYQGEELGQTETVLAYEELTDPPGLRFWPEEKGRDGCRTPMVWDGGPHGGFTTGKPWLPVKDPQLARNAAAQRGVFGSVLETYRALLHFRRSEPALIRGRSRFFDLPEPILGFTRTLEGRTLACLFNLGPGSVSVTVPGHEGIVGPSQAAAMEGESLTLGANGYAFLPVPEDAAIASPG